LNDSRVLEACARGDEAALNAYDEALRHLPADESLLSEVRGLLVEQRTALQTAHDAIAHEHGAIHV